MPGRELKPVQETKPSASESRQIIDDPSHASAPHEEILQLQRTLGNRRVQKLITQAKSVQRAEPLETDKARHFGLQLGADFTGVRVHTGDGVADAHGAAAMTFGSDIHLADALIGETPDALLGHELVHTVQQAAVPTRSDAPKEPGTPAATEGEATRLGTAAAEGRPGVVRYAAPSGVQKRARRVPREEAGPEGERDPLAEVEELQDETGKGRREKRAAAKGAATPPPEPPAPVRGGKAEPRRPGGPPQSGVRRPTAAPATGPAPAPVLPPTSRGPAAPSPMPAPIPPVTVPGAANAPGISPDAPSAEIGRALIADAAGIATEIRSLVAATAASIRARAQTEIARLREEQGTNAGALTSELESGQAAVGSGEQSAVAAMQASEGAAESAVAAAGESGTQTVETAGDEQRQRAGEAGEQAGTEYETAASEQAARFREGSQSRASEAQGTVGGGESAEAQAEASEKIGEQARQNFDEDTASAEAEAERSSGEFLGLVEEGVSGFTGAVDELVPQIAGGIGELLDTVRTGFAETVQRATSTASDFADQAIDRLSQGANTALAYLSSGSEATAAAVASVAEQYAAEVETRGAELADALEQQANIAAVMIASRPAEEAREADAEARAQLWGVAADTRTQIAAIEQQVNGALGKEMSAAAREMSAATEEATGLMSAATEKAAQDLGQAQSYMAEQFSAGAQTVGEQIQQASGDAAAELETQGGEFQAKLQEGTTGAQDLLTASVTQAEADQGANLGRFEGEKEGAASQIESQHRSLSSEAGSRSDAERSTITAEGQPFLDWILPDSWTEAIKGWFKSTFGEWLGGLIYGVLSALVGVLIIVAIVAVSGPAAPFIIGGALLLGIGVGIYTRFKTFEAYNGRGPGLGEGTLLVLLGIADVTGVPQIVEGAVGYRAFSNGHKLSDFERGELIGSGVVQLIAILFAVRGLKGTGKAPAKVPPVRKPPPETKPPEPVRPPEPKPPEPKPEPKPPEPKPEPKPPEPKPEPVPLAEVPESWSKFKPEHHPEFRGRLDEFRGNGDLEPTPGLRGGEGALWLSERSLLSALKRWFKSRVADMPESIRLLVEVRAAVEGNPTLRALIDVIRVRETGSDWILRDFSPDSVPLKSAMGDTAAVSARGRAIAELEAMRGRGELTAVLRNLLKKLRKEPPSANLHWDPGSGKIVVIDMQ